MTDTKICVNDNQLDKLKKICEKYTADESYVYKICTDCDSTDSTTSHWIVIMQKMQDTHTNEERKVVDKAHAKFRANQLLVIDIINASCPENTKVSVDNMHGKKKTSYVVGSIVYPDFYNVDIETVCSGGIHYFKTLESAFFYRDNYPTDYTGPWATWEEAGQKDSEGYISDGKKSGKWTEYNDGKLESTGEYIDGRKQGKWTSWYPSGYKSREEEYGDDTNHGKLIEWYDESDNIFQSGEFTNGRKNGKWTVYHKNGSICEETNYVDGDKSGHSIQYYENGKIKSIGFFKDNQLNGNWISWHYNEQKCEESKYDNGTKKGEWSSWYENGKKRACGEYNNVGERTGNWTEWHNNGTMQSNGWYENGDKVGEWTEWDYYGNELSKYNYSYDVSARNKFTVLLMISTITMGLIAIGTKYLKLS